MGAQHRPPRASFKVGAASRSLTSVARRPGVSEGSESIWTMEARKLRMVAAALLSEYTDQAAAEALKLHTRTLKSRYEKRHGKSIADYSGSRVQ
jgi:hypothetical protein